MSFGDGSCRECQTRPGRTHPVERADAACRAAASGSCAEAGSCCACAVHARQWGQRRSRPGRRVHPAAARAVGLALPGQQGCRATAEAHGAARWVPKFSNLLDSLPCKERESVGTAVILKMLSRFSWGNMGIRMAGSLLQIC